ncbi:hypothetical protein CAOG_09007 [Capsaspora owczarzaki ATCC 30864]|uniref:Uncharacterized protein n=1 Tax=Capsaspora owczarzaki (strain ATCC 30864) TaxID=595528 RepID=A0A0D2VXS3_CAPO3|nr:hypothetical protein CAOG_09007 [Capsaspora owczarzaki ATCC 30864]KJE96482.1 hypothetical protein CAOG_009007 [Capsaspora owczarzaki ATCC 30864]|eukprot:XP_011270694.1 hypothetical protein CAOG_09007 [Capsaspora owczarzaki ATCC 30864]
MLSYESMTERQRQLYDRVKNASGTLLLDPYHANDPNLLGDAEAQAIAEALKVNTTLIVLNLDYNQIGNAGAKAIAKALKVNKTVKEICLFYNCIDKRVFRAVYEIRNGKCSSENFINCQINPLAFSLLPRFASVEDIQEVFRMLTSGLELENQPASLPALPTEIAELIMDEAQYWQSAQHTKRRNFHIDDPRWIMKVTVPQGNSIRVKAIQVLRDWSERPDNSDDCVFDLTVQDEQGDVQYECAVHPTFVKSNLALATIWPASHPILRQMREGWQVQVRASKFSLDVLFESLYVGYV